MSLLWVFTVFVFLAFQSMEKYYKDRIAAVQKSQENLKQENLTCQDRLVKLQSLVGFFRDRCRRREIRDISEIEVDIAQEGELVTSLVKLNRVPGETPREEGEREQDRGTRQYYGMEEMLFFPGIDDILVSEISRKRVTLNIENVLELFEKRICELQSRLDGLNKELQNLETAKSSELKHRRSMQASLSDTYEKLAGSQSELRERIDEVDNVLKVLQGEPGEESEEVAKIEKIVEEKEQATQSSRQLETEMSKREEDFERETRRLKNQIRVIQAKRYGKEQSGEEYESEVRRKFEQQQYDPSTDQPDGAVLFADPGSNTVYVDLGQIPNVRPGLKFEVYRVATRGMKRFQGRVEIQKVMAEVSQAIVVEQNKLDPIVAGDLVVNPVFNRESPLHFVLARNFDAHSQQRFKSLIEEVGGVVEPQITARTRFVVLGAKDTQHDQDGNYLSALEFGIPLITERDLLKYVGD